MGLSIQTNTEQSNPNGVHINMGSQRELVTRLLEHISGGHEVAAAHLGMSIGMFRDRLYMNKSRFFDLDEVLKLQELSGTTLVAEYYAEQAQCMVMPKTKTESVENLDLFTLCLKAVQSQGELGGLLYEVIQNGGVIAKERAEKIRKVAESSVKDILNITENTIALHEKSH